MSNWFVFYVQTGREQTVSDFLNKVLKRDESVAFVPQVELIYKNSKLIHKELKPMFPGYVFIDSVLDEKSIIDEAHKFVRFSESIFKLLGNDNIDYMKLSEEEKNFLLDFYDDGYIVEESKGFTNGDKIFITSGPLKGRESIIKKIDRHKRRAEIELMCLGEIRRISISLEIVSKTL